MIRRPLTTVGLKQTDIDQMESCLQRKFKNTEQNENEVSPTLRITRSGVERSTSIKPAVTSNNNTSMADNTSISPNVPDQEEMSNDSSNAN